MQGSLRSTPRGTKSCIYVLPVWVSELSLIHVGSFYSTIIFIDYIHFDLYFCTEISIDKLTIKGDEDAATSCKLTTSSKHWSRDEGIPMRNNKNIFGHWTRAFPSQVWLRPMRQNLATLFCKTKSRMWVREYFGKMFMSGGRSRCMK